MGQRLQINLAKILEIAIEISNEEGYEEINLSNIAKRLGIRTPSLYNHIKGLQDLKQEMAYQGLQFMYDSIVHVVIGVTGEEALLCASRAYINFANKSPGLYSAVSKVPQPHETRFSTLSNQLIQVFVKLLEVYQLTEEETIHAIRGLRSMLHGFSSIQMDEGFRMKYSMEDSLTFAISAFLNGLKH